MLRRYLPRAWLVVLLTMILLAPLLTAADPLSTNPSQQLSMPGPVHILGTDYLGRDVWSRLLYGGRQTLIITATGTLLAVVCGTVIGVCASLLPRLPGQAINMLLNAMLAIPSLVLALVILTLIGRGNLAVAMAAGGAQIAFHARIVRSAVMVARIAPHVDASYALGGSRWHILHRHILPGALPSIVIYAGIIFSYVLINSAALSLLGLSAAPAQPEWGSMLADGRFSFRAAPWVAIAPGLAISSIVICVQLIIDDSINRHLL